jgi:alpha-glucosidase
MQNVPIPRHRIQDPFERNVPGKGLGRDPVRTPMQWSDAPQAGFTSGEPWLPPAANYRQVNVAAQRQDPESMLALYSRLIALRRSAPTLQLGRFQGLQTETDVLSYLRGDEYLVALNLGSQPRRIRSMEGNLLISTHLDRDDERVAGTLALRADEGVIVRLARS